MTRPQPPRAGSPTAQSQEAFSSYFEKWRSFFPWRASAEKQRTKFGQVTAPDHPGVRAGRLHVHVLDILASQPGAHLAVDIDQSIVRTASNPEQTQLLRGFGVHGREFF